MPPVIVYRSILGTTKQYATWLAEELKADMVSFSEAGADLLSLHDTVIILSGTYLGRMPLVTFLKKHWRSLKDKRIFVVAVGLVPPHDPASQQSYQRIPDAIRQHITYLKIPGKIGTKESPAGPVIKENLRPIIESINKSTR